MSTDQRVELEGGELDPFGAAALPRELSWRNKEQHVGLRDPDGRLIASAGIVVAEVAVADLPPFEVVGIGGVMVNSAHRGRGLGRRVIEEVIGLAQSAGPAIAMLFCHRDRAGLYERHRFIEVAPPVIVDQLEGPVTMPMVTMWRSLRDGVTLPQGRVVVHGLPF